MFRSKVPEPDQLTQMRAMRSCVRSVELEDAGREKAEGSSETQSEGTRRRSGLEPLFSPLVSCIG